MSTVQSPVKRLHYGSRSSQPRVKKAAVRKKAKSSRSSETLPTGTTLTASTPAHLLVNTETTSHNWSLSFPHLVARPRHLSGPAQRAEAKRCAAAGT